MSTAGVSGLVWNARTLAVPPVAYAGAAKARTREPARIAPTRTRSLATRTSCNKGLGTTRTSGRPGDRLQGIAEVGARLFEPVAVAHRLVAGVDLAQPGVAQALVHLVEVLADELLLGLGDAAAVGLAGVLEGGVVDLAAARAAGRRRPAPAAARPGPAAVLGDQP